MKAYLVLMICLFSFSFPTFSAGSDDVDTEKIEKDLKKVEDSFLTKMIPSSVKEMMKKYLSKNPLAHMSEEEIRQMVLVQTSGKKSGEFLKENPKFLDFLVKWFRDDKALPALAEIMNKPKKVKYYGYYVLAIFILSFLIGLKASDKSLFKKLMFKLTISFGVMVCYFIGFYLFFREELSPTVDIIKQVFF